MLIVKSIENNNVQCARIVFANLALKTLAAKVLNSGVVIYLSSL